MTNIGFNIRMITISIGLSVGLVFVYLSLLRESKEFNWFKGNTKKFKAIALPVLIIFTSSILASTFSSLASNEDTGQIIVITDVTENRGVWGYTSSSDFSLTGKTDTGEEITIYVSVMMPYKFKTA